MAENVGATFARTLGRPDPEAPPLTFPDAADALIWDKMRAHTGAGWYRNRFLYLFAEDLQELRPCLTAWSFLLPDLPDPLIVGRNAYGAIALVENAADALSPLGVIDPLTVRYFSDGEALRFGSFIGRYLPENLLPRFLDQAVYDRFVAEGSLYLERDLCLAITKPLSLGGAMALDNFQVEGIVDYYRSTGAIYARAARDSR